MERSLDAGDGIPAVIPTDSHHNHTMPDAATAEAHERGEDGPKTALPKQKKHTKKSF